jgi:peptidylprolyl isomerase
MPHHALRTSTSLLSSFRSSQSSTLRAPLNKRFFSPSVANMVMKTYFDVSWYGPEVQVNSNGDITSKGADKGTLLLVCP